MTHYRKVRELQQNIMNVSTDIQVTSEVDDYDRESDILEVHFYTDKLNKEAFVNEIFTILHQIDVGIIYGMQLGLIWYSKDNKEFTTDVSFTF